MAGDDGDSVPENVTTEETTAEKAKVEKATAEPVRNTKCRNQAVGLTSSDGIVHLTYIRSLKSSIVLKLFTQISLWFSGIDSVQET